MFRPKFNPSNFERTKRQLTQAMNNSKTQPTAIASNVYAKMLYGENHLFSLPVSGTPETIKNININDLQNYYDNYISSEDARVVIVGDVKESEILPKLSFLSKLPKKSFKLPQVAPAKPVDKTKIYLVDVPKGAQTEFRVGNLTGLKYDATGEYYRAQLANYNLGAAFNSRINLNLREDKGWTYGARSSFSGDKYTGEFTFSSGIRADATDSALSEVMREIKEYTEKGITEDEIKFMRSSLGQADARNYETGQQKAAFISRLLEYNLTPDYITTQQKILNTITKKEIDAVAKKHIDVKKMNIILVGDKAKILPGLQKLGYEIIELDAEGIPVTKKQM
jgi:zinc protease